ncbi:MAG: ATP-binding protein [Candidatus Dependentiae bacterium]|nr:ATP-binding protein [Candidatus Dependentiae bacterium]
MGYKRAKKMTLKTVFYFLATAFCLTSHLYPTDVSNDAANKDALDNADHAALIQPAQEASANRLLQLPSWLVRNAFENAPALVQGMVKYWTLPIRDMNNPAAHRLILVGEPGTGKTTLAYAIGQILDCRVTYMPASAFVGDRRNQAAVRIRNFFNEYKKEKTQKRVIIIDELHKILEHYDNDHYDASETAAALWLALDELENYYPHIIVIATMNSASGIPPEIKSRFHGKIVTIPMPTKKQKMHYFQQMLKYNYSIKLDKSINNNFIKQLTLNGDNFSLRDFQSLIDTAQMFAYSRADSLDDLSNITLTANDLNRAMKQLKNETRDHDKQLLEKWYPIAQKTTYLTGAALNIVAIIKITKSAFKTTIVNTAIALHKLGII